MEKSMEKARFPSGAFALGMVLLSANMKEALAAGILVVLSAVFADFLKNLLKGALPGWSLRGCLWIGAGALSAAAFELAFYVLRMERSLPLMVMEGIIGILAAEDVFRARETDGLDGMLWESAIAWALWIGTGILREFLAAGTVFGYRAADFPLASAGFQKPMFAFLTAGAVIGAACLILRKTCGSGALWVIVPGVFYARPFNRGMSMGIFGEIGAVLIPVAAALVLFFSVRKKQQDTVRKKALDGLPAELLSMGIIYMILSVY